MASSTSCSCGFQALHRLLPLWGQLLDVRVSVVLGVHEDVVVVERSTSRGQRILLVGEAEKLTAFDHGRSLPHAFFMALMSSRPMKTVAILPRGTASLQSRVSNLPNSVISSNVAFGFSVSMIQLKADFGRPDALITSECRATLHASNWYVIGRGRGLMESVSQTLTAGVRVGRASLTRFPPLSSVASSSSWRSLSVLRAACCCPSRNCMSMRRKMDRSRMAASVPD